MFGGHKWNWIHPRGPYGPRGPYHYEAYRIWSHLTLSGEKVRRDCPFTSVASHLVELSVGGGWLV